MGHPIYVIGQRPRPRQKGENRAQYVRLGLKNVDRWGQKKNGGSLNMLDGKRITEGVGEGGRQASRQPFGEK